MGAAVAEGSVMKCAVGDLGRENSCVNSSHPSTAIGNCSTPLVMAGGYSPPAPFLQPAHRSVSARDAAGPKELRILSLIPAKGKRVISFISSSLQGLGTTYLFLRFHLKLGNSVEEHLFFH